MEFIEFLDRKEIEIIKLVEQAGYKTEENTQLCSLGDDYVGFLNKRKKVITICTNNAKKREGYTILKKRYNDTFVRTAIHIKKALRHEAVHVAQECNDGKLLGIKPSLSLHPSKMKALNGSIKISGEKKKEMEAYILENQPNLVEKVLKKYCL